MATTTLLLSPARVMGMLVLFRGFVPAMVLSIIVPHNGNARNSARQQEGANGKDGQ